MSSSSSKAVGYVISMIIYGFLFGLGLYWSEAGMGWSHQWVKRRLQKRKVHNELPGA